MKWEQPNQVTPPSNDEREFIDYGTFNCSLKPNLPTENLNEKPNEEDLKESSEDQLNDYISDLDFWKYPSFST